MLFQSHAVGARGLALDERAHRRDGRVQVALDVLQRDGEGLRARDLLEGDGEAAFDLLPRLAAAAFEVVAQRLPDAAVIGGWMEELPEQWFADVALSRAALAAAIAEYLQEGHAALRAEAA